MKTCICVSTQSDNQGPFEEYPVIDGPSISLYDFLTGTRGGCTKVMNVQAITLQKHLPESWYLFWRTEEGL
ncbi:hypothetical protein 206_0184 [Phage 206]|nr:hypothetical protein 203_0184 [Phage 203]ATW61748.1 hypothetical protein 206_0184 [Phage 206]VUF54480.1 Phage protein [Escherichia phage rV5_ev147]VVA46351.1 Phage protein [Escherichia phage rV5_ev156]